MPEKYLKILQCGTKWQGWKSITDADRELACTRICSLECQLLTSVQLVDLYPILQRNQEGCDDIFSTVSYSFNQHAERKRKGTRKKQQIFDISSSMANGRIINQYSLDLLLPRNISSHRSNVSSFPRSQRIRRHKVLIFFLIIFYIYKYVPYGRWILGLYRK